jgi:hypothetical protein
VMSQDIPDDPDLHQGPDRLILPAGQRGWFDHSTRIEGATCTVEIWRELDSGHRRRARSSCLIQSSSSPPADDMRAVAARVPLVHPENNQSTLIQSVLAMHHAPSAPSRFDEVLMFVLTHREQRV